MFIHALCAAAALPFEGTFLLQGCAAVPPTSTAAATAVLLYIFLATYSYVNITYILTVVIQVIAVPLNPSRSYQITFEMMYFQPTDG